MGPDTEFDYEQSISWLSKLTENTEIISFLSAPGITK